MSTIGFVPDPEAAAIVVAWVQTLADKDEKRTFLCLESGDGGRTAQAVRDALGEEGESVSTLIAIDDLMPVAGVLKHVHKRDIRLLVTAPFELPTVSGQAQPSDLRALCLTSNALSYTSK